MADTVFIPDDGITAIMAQLVASGGMWDSRKLRIYTNNITPSDASVIGDFTEAAWAGYTAQSLAAASWGTVTVGAHVASSTYPTLTFTRSTSGVAANNYGWYITDSGATKVYAAARFASAPLTVTNAGDNIAFTTLTATTQSVN